MSQLQAYSDSGYGDILIDSDHVYDSEDEASEVTVPALPPDVQESDNEDETIGSFEELVIAFGEVRTIVAAWLIEVQELQEVQGGKHKELLGPVVTSVGKFIFQQYPSLFGCGGVSTCSRSRAQSHRGLHSSA